MVFKTNDRLMQVNSIANSPRGAELYYYYISSYYFFYLRTAKEQLNMLYLLLITQSTTVGQAFEFIQCH